MHAEVLIAKASTLSGWAEECRVEYKPEYDQAASLLGRASIALLALAAGKKISEEPVAPPKDEPMDEPRPG